MVSDCPLCDIENKEPQNILYSDDEFIIARTKYLKGHKERVMILTREHVDGVSLNVLNNAIKILKSNVQEYFKYTYKVVVMYGKYGSIPQHWHLCVSDLEPTADDFYQVLGTPWYTVIDIKAWK